MRFISRDQVLRFPTLEVPLIFLIIDRTAMKNLEYKETWAGIALVGYRVQSHRRLVFEIFHYAVPARIRYK